MAMVGIGAALTGFLGGIAMGKQAKLDDDQARLNAELKAAQVDKLKSDRAAQDAVTEGRNRSLDDQTRVGYDAQVQAHAEKQAKYDRDMAAYAESDRSAPAPVAPIAPAAPVYRAGQKIADTRIPAQEFKEWKWGMETPEELKDQSLTGKLGHAWNKLGRGVHTVLGDNNTDAWIGARVSGSDASTRPEYTELQQAKAENARLQGMVDAQRSAGAYTPPPAAPTPYAAPIQNAVNPAQGMQPQNNYGY